MSLLQKATLITTPTAHSNGTLHSIKGGAVADFDVVRGSSATRVNAEGLIEDIRILSGELVADGSFTAEGVEQITNGDFSNGSTGWTLTDGCSIIEQGLRIVSDGTIQDAIQSSVVTNGKTYKVQYEIIEAVSGSLKIVGTFGANLDINSTVGVHTFYATATDPNFNIRRNANPTDITITNISVVEVAADWTLGSGWSVSDGKAVATNAPSGQSVRQNTVATSISNGSIARVSFEVLSISSGSFGLYFGGSLVGSLNSVGVFEADFVKGTETSFYIRALGTTTGSIDNISVIEITDATNIPRIDYTTGEGVVLLEPQSTNLITYSSDFSNGWINTGTTDVISSTMLSPNGLDYSTLLVGDVATASTKRIRNAVTPIASTAHTFSVFVKSANRTYIQIINSGDAQGYANFDIANGIVGNTGSKTTANITSLNNDWYRCEISTDATTSNGAFMIYLVDSNTANFGGQGTSIDGVYIWGAQIEALSYATSYIPTSGAIASRLADSVTGAGDATTFNSTEGVLYAEMEKLSSVGDGIIGLFGNSASSQLRLEIVGSVIKAQLFNGSFQTNMSSTQVVTDNNKIAFKYKENDFALWFNGVEVATDNNGVTFNANELIKFNLTAQDNISVPFYGKVKALAVFNEALTDSELECLTKI